MFWLRPRHLSTHAPLVRLVGGAPLVFGSKETNVALCSVRQGSAADFASAGFETREIAAVEQERRLRGGGPWGQGGAIVHSCVSRLGEIHNGSNLFLTVKRRVI